MPTPKFNTNDPVYLKCREYHYMLWDELREHPEMEKSDTKVWHKVKEDVAKGLFPAKVAFVAEDLTCFACATCAAADREKEIAFIDCTICPCIWRNLGTGERVMYCCSSNTAYILWRLEANPIVRSELARIIRDCWPDYSTIVGEII